MKQEGSSAIRNSIFECHNSKLMCCTSTSIAAQKINISIFLIYKITIIALKSHITLNSQSGAVQFATRKTIREFCIRKVKSNWLPIRINWLLVMEEFALNEFNPLFMLCAQLQWLQTTVPSTVILQFYI